MALGGLMKGSVHALAVKPTGQGHPIQPESNDKMLMSILVLPADVMLRLLIPKYLVYIHKIPH